MAGHGHSRRTTKDADAGVEPGQIVTNPKVPEWGPGEVLPLEGKIARVRFRDLPRSSQVKVLSLEHVDLGAVQVPVRALGAKKGVRAAITRGRKLAGK